MFIYLDQINICYILSDPCGVSKRFKAMSPNSMTMPTSSTWEMGQGLSPYTPLPPPDMHGMKSSIK